ncbi:MAG: hypothetical protein K2L90_03805 [Muribaculaceae bacterium]|nr:hypothetical protein [Muribaculaceae bacterium]
MKPTEDLLNKINRSSGMTVPEGYFADFAARMERELPQQPVILDTPRTIWQKLRPYTYMAAMFAGIWCMLQMFNMMSPQSTDPSSNPVLAEALDNTSFVSDYCMADMTDYDILDELYSEGVTTDELIPEQFRDNKTEI